MSYQKFTVTIPAEESEPTGLSTAIDIGEAKQVGIIMPAAWTEAAITFAVSDSTDGTYASLIYDEGTEVSIDKTVAVANAAIWIPCLTEVPFRFLKLRSGTVGTPVGQAAARTIAVLTK